MGLSAGRVLHSFKIDKGNELMVCLLQVEPIATRTMLCLGHAFVHKKIVHTTSHLRRIACLYQDGNGMMLCQLSPDLVSETPVRTTQSHPWLRFASQVNKQDVITNERSKYFLLVSLHHGLERSVLTDLDIALSLDVLAETDIVSDDNDILQGPRVDYADRR